jgi:NAD(P)-dependent dehydrogenase (short-subunit alcohol dehydrogenase family)
MSTRQPSQTLQDQSWVLVTGASSGFGEEFARQYAAQGRLEKPVSDLGTLEDLSQSAESAIWGDRKSLILNGEMLERSIRHAWKA